LSDLAGHVLADLRLDLRGAIELTLESHERDDRLAGELIRLGEDHGPGVLRVRDDRGLHLGAKEQLSRDLDDLVEPPNDPRQPRLSGT
jgi:hypothetical protein